MSEFICGIIENDLHASACLRIHNKRAFHIDRVVQVIILQNADDIEGELIFRGDTQILKLFLRQRRIVIRIKCVGVDHDKADVRIFCGLKNKKRIIFFIVQTERKICMQILSCSTIADQS